MRDIAAAKTCTPVGATRGQRMRRPSLASFEDALERALKSNIKNPNMGFYHEQNSYASIDARDGREWHALLRVSARNPAAHSNVFVSFGSD